MVLGRLHFLSAAIFLFGCSGSEGNGFVDAPGSGTTSQTPIVDASTSGSGAQCKACVTDGDCGTGSVCAQFGGDTYCAAVCPNGDECASSAACTPLSTASGEQVSACVPRGNVCGASIGATDAGATGGNGGGGNTCGGLDGPSAKSSCNSCGTHACQANGCYGGWYCNPTTSKCQSPPANCGGSGSGGSGGGPGAGGPFDGGAPSTGTIGASGGTVSRLLFAVIGDTRPASIDDTAKYPTAIIDGIYAKLQSMSPSPPFAVSTGDYMFATPSGSQAGTQLDLYLAARSKYSGSTFPAMGNHECTGATASNCGGGTTDGVTSNYTAFLTKMLGPIQKTDPYYSIEVDAADGSWTSKFVFIAGNAWTSAQSTWLDATMAKPTTYTFVVRHEPAAASTAPGVSPSESILANHPYTIKIVGHTHTYGRPGTKQVLVGNGGAPITGGVNYGFAVAQQRDDKAIQFDMIDYQTGLADTGFRFAVNPDGSAAP